MRLAIHVITRRTLSCLYNSVSYSGPLMDEVDTLILEATKANETTANSMRER